MTNIAEWRSFVDVLVLHPQAPRVLVEQRDGAWAIPRLPIENLSLVALDEINLHIERLYGFPAAILCLLTQQVDSDQKTVHSLRLVENLAPDWVAPDTLRWVGCSELATIVFANEHHRTAAAETLTALETDAVPAARVPWARQGWYQSTSAWLTKTLTGLGYAPIGRAEQVKTWVLSCVLRVPTERGFVYFKVSNQTKLMVNEATFTQALAELLPHMPKALAIDEERVWLLMEDFGDPIRFRGADAAPVELREELLTTFARFQIAALPYREQLIERGCIDRSLPKLAEAIKPLLTDARWLAYVEPERRVALQAAIPTLEALCVRVAGYRVPETLGHGDLHLANVTKHNDAYVFFDWTDACIMHPFFDMIDIMSEEDAAVRIRLRDAYLAQWTDYEPTERLLELWNLTYPLMAVHQAVSYAAIIEHVEAIGLDAFAWAMPFWFGQILEALPTVADLAH